MPRHSIHLGDAWQPPTKATGAWVRRFGRPTGVGAGDRLFLVCERLAGAPVWRRLELNGRELPPVEPGMQRWECDVTALLDGRNELVLLPAAAEAAAMGSGARMPLPRAWGRMTIEIEAPD
jgi:hypothetical protein